MSERRDTDSVEASAMQAPRWIGQFPLETGLYYLNHAAVAPWPRCAAEAAAEFAAQNARSGARDYRAWMHTVASLRERLRALINAPSADDVALLKNTSEGLSVVAHGLDWHRGDNVVTSDQEFPSNRIVWESLGGLGVELREADLSSGRSPEDALAHLCDERTRVLAISSVQYGSGLRMNLDELGAMCRRRGILLCVDAIQSVGAHVVDVRRSRADFLTADGHKWMLGPEGVALFYCRPEHRSRLRLHQYGWHMVEHAFDYERRTWEPAASARRFECGSLNMLGIHALHASVGLLLEIGMARVEHAVLANARHLLQRLARLPRVHVVTPIEDTRRAGIVTFRIDGADTGKLHAHLQQRGVVCAQRAGGIRFSPHFYTPNEALDAAVAAVAEFLP